MTAADIRGIAVLDIGATNSKALLFDARLDLLAERSVPARRHAAPPYLAIDPQPVMALIESALPEFDARLPVDAIVPCAHGSSAVLLDDAGEPALPIMSYEAEPPPAIVDGYAALAPPFTEVLAPTNPAALTLARQLYWQETLFPAEFARVRTILPLAQYIALWLCGERASEVSAWGAQTHLWAPLARDYSTLARARRWTERFAPLRSAWQPLAAATHLRLRGRAAVLTGVHDSNANLLRYLGGPAFTLLSTGTWIIGFVPGIDLTRLDPRSDQVANTSVSGEAIASCRFMGGREFDAVADGAPAALANRASVRALLGRRVNAWPSFTTSGGPVPGSGGMGRIDGAVDDAAERASLASLYCAQMSALMLRKIGGRGRVIVDGPFSDNDAYLEVLAACLPGRAVLASAAANGTAVGAATLALRGAASRDAAYEPTLRRVEAPRELLDNVALRRWFERVGR